MLIRDFRTRLLILLADTWLHLETETVTISKSLNLDADATNSRIKAFGLETLHDRFAAEDIRSAVANHTRSEYSRGEDEPNYSYLGLYGTYVPSTDCLDVGSLFPCSMPFSDLVSPDYPLLGQLTVSRFLANSSTWARPQILPYRNGSDDGNLTLIAPTTLWQTSSVSLDFTARTYGALTTCRPMNDECGFQAKSSYSWGPFTWSFNCNKTGSTFQLSSGIDDTNEPPPFENHTIHSDPQYSQPYRWNVPVLRHRNNTQVGMVPTLDVVNPSYPAAVLVSRNHGYGNGTVAFGDDAGSAMTLFCKHTIMDVHYSFINGTFAIIDASPSSKAIANITNIPLTYGFLRSYFNSSIDATMAAGSSQEAANLYATTYSLASTAILSGILRPSAAEEAQIRRRVLVTRVPKAPLFTLIALNVLYAAMGLVLALDALRALHKDASLVDLQARLSTAGLTAECFEDEDTVGRIVDSSEDLFGEKTGVIGRKIGVVVQPTVSALASVREATADKGDSTSSTSSTHNIEEAGRERPQTHGTNPSQRSTTGWRLARVDVEEMPRRRRLV